MLLYPNIDPVAFSVGLFRVHWYGLMYTFGFLFAWLLCLFRSRSNHSVIGADQVTEMILYNIFGLMIGARLGQVLFYDFLNFIHNPLMFFQVWKGGMSFYGGLVGVIISMIIYAKKINQNTWDLLDFVMPAVPIGLGLGRIGNFINGELWGRVTDSAIGMIFPKGGPLPRYPSQLVESLFEGLILFLILWIVTIKPRQRFFTCALFLFFYGLFRFFIEFIRQPEPQMGFVLFDKLTEGQALAIPVFSWGFIGLICIYFRKNKKYNPNAEKYLAKSKAFA